MKSIAFENIEEFVSNYQPRFTLYLLYLILQMTHFFLKKNHEKITIKKTWIEVKLADNQAKRAKKGLITDL